VEDVAEASARVHLKHSTWIYLAALPFQLERYLGWVTIPAVMIAAFMFLGFLGVAAQVSSPFSLNCPDLTPAGRSKAPLATYAALSGCGLG
jgi:predicted membrane chloride channel (bestrophin family)